MSELFVEFICEEIPARMQKGAIAHMKQFLLNSFFFFRFLFSSYLLFFCIDF